jgi:hypothetical protein
MFPWEFFVPSSQQNSEKTFFLHLHSISHSGRLASWRLVSSRFVWRSLANDVTSCAKSCLHCQWSKIHRHTRLLPQPIPILQQQVDPLQYSSDCNHIFTIIDRTSKWMEAICLSETSAAACACALVFSCITRFGVPKTITSDHGPQFTSNVWSQLCNMLHITHRQTTAESSGAVERIHCHLKDALCAQTAAATWAEKIPWLLLGLHAQPREDTGLSPAEAGFGAPIVLPNEFLKGDEIPVNTISKKFLKSLKAPAFSLPRHNLSSPAAQRDGHAGRHPPRRSSCFQAGLILRPASFFPIAARAAENPPRNHFYPIPHKETVYRMLYTVVGKLLLKSNGFTLLLLLLKETSCL